MTSRPATSSGQRGLPQRFGRYELTSLIARGGMAEIFVATQRSEGGFSRRVVVKRILPHLGCDPEFTRMFLDEARIAMRLSHPHIAHTYDVGKEGDEAFIVLELVDGPSLRDLSKRGRLPEGVALRIAADVAAALSHAHRLTDDAGHPLAIVHRDVSPHNILVGRDGSVKLIDFGIAKARTQLHDTESGSLKGKFAYMAPEQFQGSGVDPRTDLFSLSVVLWEMLAGQRLFKHESAPETMRAICSDDRPRLSSVRPGTAAALERLAHKGLERLPANRWSDAERFAIALEEHIARTGVAASSIHVGQHVRATEDRVSSSSGTLADAPTLIEIGGAAAVPTPPPTQSATPFAAERTPPSVGPRRGVVGLAISVGVGVLAGLVAAAASLSDREPPAITARPMVSPVPLSHPAPAQTASAPAAPGRLPGSAPSESVGAAQAPSTGRTAVGTRATKAGAPATVRARPATRETHAPADGPGASTVGRGPGRLFVNTRPWSRVYLRGRLLGTTPLGNVEVPGGPQRLTFELEDHTKVSRPVTIRTDGPTKAFFELR
ncbi:MAG: protein kinase [Deltaproteobacteria bacterium]|nr:protein kinase [Deltaproteobacteria bacterium]